MIYQHDKLTIPQLEKCLRAGGFLATDESISNLSVTYSSCDPVALNLITKQKGE